MTLAFGPISSVLAALRSQWLTIRMDLFLRVCYDLAPRPLAGGVLACNTPPSPNAIANLRVPTWWLRRGN
jgi:hypothetical protein